MATAVGSRNPRKPLSPSATLPVPTRHCMCAVLPAVCVCVCSGQLVCRRVCLLFILARLENAYFWLIRSELLRQQFSGATACRDVYGGRLVWEGVPAAYPVIFQAVQELYFNGLHVEASAQSIISLIQSFSNTSIILLLLSIVFNHFATLFWKFSASNTWCKP